MENFKEILQTISNRVSNSPGPTFDDDGEDETSLDTKPSDVGPMNPQGNTTDPDIKVVENSSEDETTTMEGGRIGKEKLEKQEPDSQTSECCDLQNMSIGRYKQ